MLKNIYDHFHKKEKFKTKMNGFFTVDLKLYDLEEK